MKVRVPKDWQSLAPAQRSRIEEYCRGVALEAAHEALERDNRIILDRYIKMVCWMLHEAFGFGEKRLNHFLAVHSAVFRDQHKKVNDGAQVAFLEEKMARIFKKNGFPQSFFDNRLGPLGPFMEE